MARLPTWTWRKTRGLKAYDILKGGNMVDLVMQFQPGLLVEDRNKDVALLQKRIRELESELRSLKGRCKCGQPIGQIVK